MKKAFATPALQSGAVDTVDALGDAQYLPDMMTLASSDSVAPQLRATALTALGSARNLQYLPQFQSLASSGPVPVRIAAVRAVKRKVTSPCVSVESTPPGSS